jgi:hypothetical protein
MATLRVQAYVDFIACLSDSAHLSLARDEAEIFARAASGKTRISIYGQSTLSPRWLPSKKQAGR